MIGETFESVSQIAHFLFGMLIVVLFAYLFNKPEYGALLVFGWSMVKEFWYDLKYEAPGDSGGFWGSVRDFFYYNVGLGVGYSMVLIKAVI